MRTLERLGKELPIQKRKLLREAGNIFVEELSNATSRFTRSKGRWDKNSWGPSERLKDSFKLRSVQWDILQITSSSLYWDIQESGDLGRVKPDTKKAMLVPFTGVSREYIATAHAAGRTFIRKDVILERVGKRNLIPLGKFFQSIKIKPKRYVGKAEIKATPRIEKLFREAIANI